MIALSSVSFFQCRLPQPNKRAEFRTSGIWFGDFSPAKRIRHIRVLLIIFFGFFRYLPSRMWHFPTPCSFSSCASTTNFLSSVCRRMPSTLWRVRVARNRYLRSVRTSVIWRDLSVAGALCELSGLCNAMAGRPWGTRCRRERFELLRLVVDALCDIHRSHYYRSAIIVRTAQRILNSES